MYDVEKFIRKEDGIEIEDDEVFLDLIKNDKELWVLAIGLDNKPTSHLFQTSSAENLQKKRDIPTENDIKKLKLIKMLSTLSHDENNWIDSNFSEIILDDFSVFFNKKVLEEQNFITNLKPYLFDALKRISRLTKIKSVILEYTNQNDEEQNANFEFLNKLDERDLVCALIECVNPKSRVKLGKLIVKNDYPLPLSYSMYNFRNECLELKISFDVFDEVL